MTKQDKLRVIQNFLSGVIDLQAYMPPKVHTVTIDEDKVVIVSPTNPKIEMNIEQYKQWKETLPEHDLLFEIMLERYDEKPTCIIPGDFEHKPVVFVPQKGNEPLDEESTAAQLHADYEAEKKKQVFTPAESPKPRKRAVIKPVDKIQAIQVEEDIFPVMPNSGKLSDYGITWKLRNN